MDTGKTPKPLVIFANHLEGGTGTFVSQLVRLNEKSRNAPDIYVLALQRPPHRQIEKVKGSSVRYFSTAKRVNGEAYRVSPTELIRALAGLFWFYQQIKKLKPMAVITLDTHCALVGCVVGMLSGQKAPLVLTFHNNVEEVFKKKLPVLARGFIRYICIYFFNRANYCIGISAGVARSITSHFKLKHKALIIPYGIDNKKIIKNSKKITPDHKPFFLKSGNIVLSAGRLAQQKDFKTLVQSFPRVLSRVTDARLVIVGDGPQRHDLETMADQLGLGQNVHFVGWQQNTAPFFLQAKVFVLSSFYEGFSFVLLEAMLLGVPVISTRTPFGPEELLDNGRYGLLVPMAEPKAMAEAIIRVLQNRARFQTMAELAKQRAQSYTLEKMLDRYSLLLKNINKAL